MEDLHWILLGLGIVVLAGLFLFARMRRDGGLPFDDVTTHDPLAGPQGMERKRSEPVIEDISGWTEEGTGPVRRRIVGDDEVPPPLPAQRRKPHFDFGKLSAPAQTDLPLTDDRRNEEAAETQGVVTLYLIARDAKGFEGARLVELLDRYGFEFGDMDVYHHNDVEGRPQFSLMNGVAPGTFDPSLLPTQTTPALALFLRLPIRAVRSLVFDQFLDTAHRLADELHAELLDDRREPLSPESVDRMREVALGV